MPISIPGDRDDVNEGPSAAAAITVGTSAIEIKAGSTRLGTRQFVVIFNDSNGTMFTSPSASVTSTGATKGIPLFKNQERVIPVGDIAHYVIGSAAGLSAIVQEIG